MTRTGEVVPSLERVRNGGVHIGQRTVVGRFLNRIDAHPPECRIGGIHDEPPKTILRVLGRGVGSNQIFAPLRNLGFRLDEIERRNLPGIDTDFVFARELLRKFERSLLNGDIGHGGLERPVRLLDRRNRLNDRLAEAELRALLVSLRDDVLLSRGVDRPILEQRL